jgi:hypothetical protein
MDKVGVAHYPLPKSLPHCLLASKGGLSVNRDSMLNGKTLYSTDCHCRHWWPFKQARGYYGSSRDRHQSYLGFS